MWRSSRRNAVHRVSLPCTKTHRQWLNNAFYSTYPCIDDSRSFVVRRFQRQFEKSRMRSTVQHAEWNENVPLAQILERHQDVSAGRLFAQRYRYSQAAISWNPLDRGGASGEHGYEHRGCQ